MSVARPATRRLISGRLAASPVAPCAAPTPTTAPCQQVFAHQFHSSRQLSARRRPRFANVRAADMGLMSEKQIDDFTKEKFPQYTKEELDHLRTKYSPAQIAALEAGEAAINPRDLTVQGRLRNDPYTIPYIDDFAETQPVIDKRAKNKEAPDPSARFMNMDEFTQDLIMWADKFQVGDVTGQLKTLVDFVPEEFKKVPEGNWPGDVREEAHKAFQQYLEAEVKRQNEAKDVDDVGGGPTDADILQYILERSAMTDNGRTTNTSLAHALPSKVPGVAGLYKKAIDPADMGLDDIGVYQDLKRRTGMSVVEILRLQTKQLVDRSVANQTRLGKVRKTSVMYCAGNGNGWLGIGEAKSTEPSIAMLKARLMAIRNMQPIRRYENRTIYGTVEAKVSGTVVRMSARPPGFGLRVSHRIFEMCRAAGITDLAATIPRSRNPMNSVKAAYKALLTQPDPEEIAMGRGKKLVDVRKVYYGGAVY
ncbi:ribosomal protein s5-like protein [Parathielavia appendiculata]|uniref:Small ribosomal subunit protein uS5m n=1 Tax=Parathielavia appendiculata TaxID=2587402 RepID=A0AAN6TYM1_9PEZI|nr:ribosomal protein s5-like protein [Parathielavia appendiculata]